MMDNATFNELLVQAHKHCVERLINITNSKADAEDVFMDAMYAFWKNWQAGKIKHHNNLKGLIFVMAKNLWYNKKRKEQRSAVKEYATAPENISIYEGYNSDIYEEVSYNPLIKSELAALNDTENKARQKAFNAAMQRLDEKCQTLLKQSIVYKVRLKQLREKLGFVSVDAVKMAKHRCKKTLIKYYKAATNK